MQHARKKIKAHRQTLQIITDPCVCVCVCERDEWDLLTWGDTLAASNFKLSHSEDKVKRFGSGEYSHQ